MHATLQVHALCVDVCIHACVYAYMLTHNAAYVSNSHIIVMSKNTYIHIHMHMRIYLYAQKGGDKITARKDLDGVMCIEFTCRMYMCICLSYLWPCICISFVWTYCCLKRGNVHRIYM